ncbi:hypothetical protein LT493_10035 [Streptomyces tricolor]|nr:hypothetical protein [Streptomyces tricolor]
MASALRAHRRRDLRPSPSPRPRCCPPGRPPPHRARCSPTGAEVLGKLRSLAFAPRHGRHVTPETSCTAAARRGGGPPAGTARPAWSSSSAPSPTSVSTAPHPRAQGARPPRRWIAAGLGLMALAFLPPARVAGGSGGLDGRPADSCAPCPRWPVPWVAPPRGDGRPAVRLGGLVPGFGRAELTGPTSASPTWSPASPPPSATPSSAGHGHRERGQGAGLAAGRCALFGLASALGGLPHRRGITAGAVAARRTRHGLRKETRARHDRAQPAHRQPRSCTRPASRPPAGSPALDRGPPAPARRRTARPRHGLRYRPRRRPLAPGRPHG